MRKRIAILSKIDTQAILMSLQKQANDRYTLADQVVPDRNI
jgi:hypothetical protein